MDIAVWLRDLGLEQYEQAFRDNDIDAEVLPELSNDVLKDIGVSSAGHRIKLLKAIAAIGAPPEPVAAAAAGARRSEAVAGPSAAQAERRQITVMFVDLVGSTAMSSRLDPEDMRTVMAAYQNSVAQVVARFGGHVAKYMGDGVLCYFGWPHAHEDDAERAIRTSLAALEAASALRTAHGERLSVRVGIATGLVVIGDLIGSGAAQEEAVVGETPNLAARLQGLAEPDQVVISESTRRLIGGTFEVTSLGPQTLKGFPASVSAFAVIGTRASESRFASKQSGGLSAMVGREHELGLLVERWRQAKSGEGQLALMVGEAGIGKSRLTRGMIDAACEDAHVRLSYQCSPYHVDSPLYPAMQQIGFAAGFVKDDSNDDMLDRLEAVLVGPETDRPIFAALLGLDGEQRYGKLNLTPAELRAQTLQALIRQLLVLGASKPVLFVIEDVHWIDATTLELVDLCLDPVAKSRVMILATARPTFQHGFGGHPIVTKLTLNKLGRGQVNSIISRLAGGKTVPEAVVDIIATKTDGVPLFVEEFTKTILESGELVDTGTALELRGPLKNLTIPSSLYDSLISRLDRLKQVKDIAQVASCIGRTFDYSLLQAVLPIGQQELNDGLDHLVGAELIFQRGSPPTATYTFKHALLQDAAYETLLKTRRQAIHTQLLTALEERKAEPEILAHHAQAAGQWVVAIRYLLLAGQRLSVRSANKEARRQFEYGIELLKSLPPSKELAGLEFRLYLGLGPVLRALKGHSAPETEHAFTRAQDLIDEANDLTEKFAILYGIWGVALVRPRLEESRLVAARAIKLLEDSPEAGPEMHPLVCRMMGESLWGLGRLVEARQYLEKAVALCEEGDQILTDFRYSLDHHATANSFLSEVLFLLGYPERAKSTALKALHRAEELRHVATKSHCLWTAVHIAEVSRDVNLLEQFAEKGYAYCAEHGIKQWENLCKSGLGLLRLWANDPNGSASIISQVMEVAKHTEIGLYQATYRPVLAEACFALGDARRAIELMDEAISVAHETGERYFDSELCRLKGEFLLPTDAAAGETCFERALEIAREQSAKSWELRAAVSLARLWRGQGKADEARSLLAPIYGWFSEGFDTPDLKSAKALLDTI